MFFSRKLIFSLVLSSLCPYSAQAAVTFLPDYVDKEYTPPSVDLLCIRAQNGQKYVYSQSNPRCPVPKVFDHSCPHNDHYITPCYCPKEYNLACDYPLRGNSQYSCDGLWASCCDTRCPSGYSTSGCSKPYIEESTAYTGCGEKCYTCKLGNDCTTANDCSGDEIAEPSGGTNDFNHMACVTCTPPPPPCTDCSCDPSLCPKEEPNDPIIPPVDPDVPLPPGPDNPDNPDPDDPDIPDPDKPVVDACKDYTKSSCNKYETVSECPSDKSKKKCTATCLSKINGLGAITEISGEKLVKQASNDRLIVLENSSISSLQGKYITSVQEYVKNMGIKDAGCPTGRKTLTVSNGGSVSGMFIRDINLLANGSLTASNTTITDADITLGGSSNIKLSSGSLSLSGTVNITGGSSSAATVDVSSGNLSVVGGSSVMIPRVRMSGSSASASIDGSLRTQWVYLGNYATMRVGYNGSLSATNQGTYNDINASSSSNNYGSSIFVTEFAKLLSSGRTTAPRISVGYKGVVMAKGGNGYIEASYDINIGLCTRGASDNWGYAGSTGGGKMKTQSFRMQRGSCMCVGTNNSKVISTADGGWHEIGWNDQNNFYRSDEGRDNCAHTNISNGGTSQFNDSGRRGQDDRWTAKSDCKNGCNDAMSKY